MTWKNVGNSIAPVGRLGITCEHAHGMVPAWATVATSIGQEVAPVKLYSIDERPSALPAACAPTSGLPVARVDSVEAHVDHVGRTAVGAGLAVQAANVQVLNVQMQWHPVQSDGTTRFAAAANEHRT